MDGGAASVITPSPPMTESLSKLVAFSHLAWMPDGKSVLLSVHLPSRWLLVIVDRDGRWRTVATSDTRNLSNPLPSPDGSQIAVIGTISTTTWSYYPILPDAR
jgi:hypothetical protein